MREILGKLWGLAFTSPLFVGQLALSVLLSVSVVVFAINFAGAGAETLAELFAHGGLFDTVMFLMLMSLVGVMGWLLVLITRSSIRGTFESAHKIVADVGEVATISRRVIRRRAEPDTLTRGGLSLDVPVEERGMLSAAAFDAHGLEVAHEPVALDFEREEVSADETAKAAHASAGVS